MGSSIQFISGLAPCQFTSKSCCSRPSSYFSFKNSVKSNRDKEFGYKMLKGSAVLQGCLSVYGDSGINRLYCEGKLNKRLESLKCKCQPAESIREAIVDGKSGKLVNGVANASSLQKFDGAQRLTDEKADNELAAASEMSDTLQGFGINSIEDEAWNLLRASIVYYCNNPIGTIAANDPSSANILNYDQIFIRDFIPSGIAFLLKGEYDIVRNFILHTLQLQVTYKHQQTSDILSVCISHCLESLSMPFFDRRYIFALSKWNISSSNELIINIE